ncbi:MAG TPA: hypothetical protein DD417_03305 [Elusimicrobia bacterium]|nr:hypothetical protein [Elusimicrobiota bacterium]
MALIISRGEFEGAGRIPAALARMHLALCPHCRRYRIQLELLGKAVRLRRGRPPSPEKLSALKKRIARLRRGGGSPEGQD